MSTPWCHATVARANPHESVNDVGAATGKTYGPPDSAGVPAYGWALGGGGGAAVVVVGGGSAVVVRGRVSVVDEVVVDAGVSGIDSVVTVVAGATEIDSVGTVVVVASVTVVSVTVDAVVVVVVVVAHSGGSGSTVASSHGGGSRAATAAVNQPPVPTIATAATAGAVRLSVRPMLEGKGRERYEIRYGPATIARVFTVSSHRTGRPAISRFGSLRDEAGRSRSRAA
jgi:hypothetical protein